MHSTSEQLYAVLYLPHAHHFHNPCVCCTWNWIQIQCFTPWNLLQVSLFPQHACLSQFEAFWCLTSKKIITLVHYMQDPENCLFTVYVLFQIFALLIKLYLSAYPAKNACCAILILIWERYLKYNALIDVFLMVSESWKNCKQIALFQSSFLCNPKRQAKQNLEHCIAIVIYSSQSSI